MIDFFGGGCTMSNKLHSKKIWLIIGIITLIIIVITVFLLVRLFGQNNPVIATFEGEQITLKEYELFVEEARSEVLNDINARYESVMVDEKFWTTALEDGEVPGQMVQKKALEAAKEMKAHQILYREAGLIEDISYAGFKKAFHKENRRRQNAIKKGEPIYGPETLEALDFWEYWSEHLNSEYKTNIPLSTPVPSESSLVQFYMEERKNQPSWKSSDTITAQKVLIPYVLGKNQDQAWQFAEILTSNFDEQLSQLPDTVTVVTETYTKDKNNSTDGSMISDYEATWKLEVGQVSPIYDLRDAYVVYRCLSIKKGTYYTFDVLREAILEAYYQKQWDKKLGDLMKKNIVVNVAVWAELPTIF